jgi:hypothetical protein
MDPKTDAPYSFCVYIIAAAALIGLVVQEKERIPVPHPSFGKRLRLLPKAYRRLLLAVGIFGAGAFAHTLLILWAAQRLTPLHLLRHADPKGGPLFHALENR